MGIKDKLTTENPNAFKLQINEKLVHKYFKSICAEKSKINEICKKLNALELRDRVRLLAKELRNYLHSDYKKALKQLLQITKAENMASFELWPATEFIQLFGLNYIEESMLAMAELTNKFTAEFCIRPFINHYGLTIYDKLSLLKFSKDEHIRRWVSEGTRPRLPWGEKLTIAIENPQYGLNLLEDLKFDTSLYVRKSVANHLNDISKDHPHLVVDTLKRWQKVVPQDYENEFQFIVHRALRTLIKKADMKALKFVGVKDSSKDLKFFNFKLEKNKIKIGEDLKFSFSVKNNSKKRIKYLIDFIIFYKKSNHQLKPKVFKLKSGQLSSGEVLLIDKKNSFKPVTTRKYYSGIHKIAIQLNGLPQNPLEFELLVDT